MMHQFIASQRRRILVSLIMALGAPGAGQVALAAGERSPRMPSGDARLMYLEPEGGTRPTAPHSGDPAGLYLEPVAGLSTARHPAPPKASVPLGTVLRFTRAVSCGMYAARAIVSSLVVASDDIVEAISERKRTRSSLPEESSPEQGGSGTPLPGADSTEQVEFYAPAFFLGPVAGITTAWHPAPPSTAVPVGTTLQFKVTYPRISAGSLQVTGLDLITVTDQVYIGECVISSPGKHVVAVQGTIMGLEEDRPSDSEDTAGDPTPSNWSFQTVLEGLEISPESIIITKSSADVSPIEISDGVSETEFNAQTMEYYYGESIARVRRLAREEVLGLSSGHRQGRFERNLLDSTDRYLTSVARTLTLHAEIHPAAFSPLIEWRVDGDPVGLGPIHEAKFPGVGVHVLHAGPPDTERELEVHTYSARITSHTTNQDTLPEGTRVTLTAETVPPGYEDDITWLASTLYGQGSPVLGSGPSFSVQFDDTWGPFYGDPDISFQWLGVKADNTIFNQDQKVKLTMFPQIVSFEDVAIGNAVTNVAGMVNLGTQPIVVVDVSAAAPFSTDFANSVTIQPGEWAGLQVTFAPLVEGVQAQPISVTLEGGSVAILQVTGRGVVDQDSQPENWFELEVVSGPTGTVDGSILVFHHTVYARPFGPISSAHDIGEIEFFVNQLPVGTTAIFPASPFEDFVGEIIRHLEVHVPAADCPTDLSFNVIAELYDTFGALLSAETVTVPLVCNLAFIAPCECPPGTPPAANAVLDTETRFFPDSPIPGADGEGATVGKVSQVVAEVKGPGLGECCIDAKFELNVRIASDFALPGGGVDDNDNTAHQLIRACRGVGGMVVLAETKGAFHGAFTSTADSAHACPAGVGAPALPAPGAAIGNIEIQTMYDVPIECPRVVNWPCQVAENDHITRIFYDGVGGLPAGVGGAGAGGMDIFWRVDISGDNCVIGGRVGAINKILFIRQGAGPGAAAGVYDPDNHDYGWLRRRGDGDGDGVNDYRELRDGTDPTDPNDP